jgi:serine/threonine protein kinase
MSSLTSRGVEEVYQRRGHDVDFGELALSVEVKTDTALAELIEADGRLRISRGKPVSLERYLNAVGDLRKRPDPLDAAIDVALRSLAGSARATPDAIDRLVIQFPDLERAIREAAALNTAIWSTTGLRARVTPPPAKPLPCQFGPRLASGQQRYELQKLLGQGAFGQVYLALDRQLSEEGHTALVAIKVLVSGDRSPWARQTMIEEATKVRRINHPNVVLVMDRGVTEQDEDFIVYEFVDGGDLSQLTENGSSIAARRAAELVMQIARGVHAAHSAGVIHCDLKPGNIMLTAAGSPKVADFGIAVRLADAGRSQGSGDAELDGGSRTGPIGNLAFVSPEQYRGEDGALSIPSDIYALGGILFSLFTGRLPNGSTLEEIAKTHHATYGRAEPPLVRTLRPQVDRDLEAICRRALAVQPEDRYSSAAALSEDLERWLKLEPIEWTRPGVLRTLNLWRRRKPGVAISLLVIIALLIGGSFVAMHFASVARDRELLAAVNKGKFEKEQEYRDHGRARSKTLRSALSVLKDDYRFNTEVLTYIWIFEYIYGPAVYGMPDVQSELWKSRIAQTRNLVHITRAAGREDDMETLLWESALGFWLVCDKDYLEAEPLLDQNLQKWRQKIKPDDNWIANLEAIRLCAAANRYVALAAATPVDRTQIEPLETALAAAGERVAQRHEGTPIHFLVLDSRASLWGPNLLNDPVRHDQMKRDLQVLKDNTAVKVERNPPQSRPDQSSK